MAKVNTKLALALTPGQTLFKEQSKCPQAAKGRPMTLGTGEG
jgi:hypothetical protein